VYYTVLEETNIQVGGLNVGPVEKALTPSLFMDLMSEDI